MCSEYDTKQLPNEEATYIHHCAAQAKQGKQTDGGGSTREDGPNVKRFNMVTYKIHVLGDYADQIERFGPTNCFTTQYVCQQPFCSRQ